MCYGTACVNLSGRAFLGIAMPQSMSIPGCQWPISIDSSAIRSNEGRSLDGPSVYNGLWASLQIHNM